MNLSIYNKVALGFGLTLAPLAAFSQQPNTASASPAATPTPVSVTTTGGTRGLLPAFDSPSSVVSSQLYTNLTYGGLGIGRVPAASLDVLGQTIFRGGAVFSRSGDATPSGGKPSFQFQFQTSVYNSNNKGTLIPNFTLQTEPTGNNTASTGATLNFLYYSGVGSTPGETGLYFNPNGVIHFAPAQTFPITAGPVGPAGPKGATGATGPAGPTGPQGPSGSLVLPYKGTGAGNSKPAFQVTNSGVYGNTAPNTPDGIAAYGGASGTASYSTAGTGITGYGGTATSTSATNTYGGIGVVGHGGAGNPSYSGSSGGFGGEFYGGDSGGGTNGFGGDGLVTLGGSPNGIGLYVYSAGQTTANTAAIFIGAVDIYGALYKSSGAFKIDHPVDPANKYLVHSFVESPDMMNIYNGNIVTDGRGEAVVTMPDYFEALNRDFRYQLTVIGQFAQAIVGSKISGNTFVIKTDKPGVEVSWQVTGVRQDAWANAHRLPNEVEKDPTEKGHFLHPELFGHPEDMSIGARRHSRLQAPQQ